MDKAISEQRFSAICRAAGWHLDRPAGYFAEGAKYDADIFYDLLEPQHYGFTLDRRYIAEDALAGVQRCLRLDIKVAGERFTSRTLKPYNVERNAWRTATLARGRERRTATYRESEPDYLISEIMDFAGPGSAADDGPDRQRSDHPDSKPGGRLFANIAQADDDAYWFVLFPAGTTARQVLPFAFQEPRRHSDADVLAATGRAARRPYAYQLVITSNLTEAAPRGSQSRVDMLTFGPPSRPAGYTSRVAAGQTLRAAVRRDLARDFGYRGSLDILDYRLLADGPQDRALAGGTAPCLLVHIATDRFDTDGLRVRGAVPGWRTVPTLSVYRQYRLGFGLHERVIE